ncbi:MAG: DUF4416 family protein [Endomicrobia bacterium]|nr:DUF4416 family protein [Endomicrobiia bacterium]MCL2507451.1 DUF4416 family protein [Endomicrobiia bacterium]
MGRIEGPNFVKLFCGIITSGQDYTDKALAELENKFGSIDFTSKMVSFDNFSDYYNPEMGNGLTRFWVSFEKLISAADIAPVKIWANSVEDSLSDGRKRKINIDPGYITPANIILATTKDFSHRIYIKDGIYGEVTTIYQKNGFVKLPWSYPDYMSETAADFLLQARSKLLIQLKEIKTEKK